jgi:hypothetical protein
VTHRTGRAVGVLAAIALLLAGCGTQSSRIISLDGVALAGSGAGTVVIPVNPHDSATTSVTITLTTTGSCQPSNRNAGNGNAFRCFIDEADPDGGNVEDPCFAPSGGPAGGSLLCLDSPDARTAVKVMPSDPPESHATPDADPWYLQLDDGTRCGVLGGATDEFNGLRLNYACPDGSQLYGEPIRSAPFWTISRRAKDAAGFTQARITRAWK